VQELISGEIKCEVVIVKMKAIGSEPSELRILAPASNRVEVPVIVDLCRPAGHCWMFVVQMEKECP
jgi:hypothetical protein